MNAVDSASTAAGSYENQVVPNEADTPAEQGASSVSSAVTSVTQTSAEEASVAESPGTISTKLNALMQETEQVSSQLKRSGTTSGIAGVVEAVVGLVTSLVGLITSLIGSTSSSSSTSASSSSKDSPQETKAISDTPSTSGSTGNEKASSSGTVGSTAQATKAGLQAIADEKGVVTVRTPDGYQIKTENKDQAWQIVGPDGRATRIWGDPHVKESDGTRWDFQKQSSFLFGANKITVETKPLANGKAVTSRITVYSGLERVTVAGIDSNKPFILAVSEDGKQHDDSLGDGDRFSRGLNKTGESWSRDVNGRKDVMGR